MILGLCEKFHTVPSVILAQDATIVRMLRVVNLDDKYKEGGEPDEPG
jgi:hypothetical protein